MLSHMQHHAVDIFEESYVTQLVQLVMTDGLDGHLLFNICNICFGSTDCSYTGTREAYFGCRAEFVNHVRITFFFTFHQDLNQVVLFILI